METREHQGSLSAISTLSNAVASLSAGTKSRRLSVSSSVATNKSRRTSKIELVRMPGGTMLLEVNEPLDDAVSIVGAHRDSLSGATTVGGLAVQPDTKQVDKLIKKEMAHHSPEIGVDDKKDPEEHSESASDAAESGASKNDEPLLKYGVINILHHLYLAMASPAIFRVPALAYKWSGDDEGSGFFLIYVMVLLVVAMPLCVLEEIMAQFSSLGTITVFRCLPILKGVGVGMVTVCFALMLYSSTIFCWSIIYTFDCFQNTLPWSYCLHNVSYCVELHAKNHSDVPEEMIPSEYYFLHKILGASMQPESNGLNLELTLSLGFLWLGLLFLLILGNPWRSGIFSKVTALITLFMLISLIFTGLPLDKSGEGLDMVFRIDFSDFAKPGIWLDALGQASWSLGPTLGILIARASYKNFRDRIRLDVYTAALSNLLVSLAVMIAVTPFHGHLDLRGNVDKSPGYFFVLSSYALTKLPVPQLGGAVLYLAICKATVDHTHMLASTVVISLSDLLPSKWRTGGRKFFCQCIVCSLGLCCGLPFIMTEGLYLLRSVDSYVPWINSLILGFAEVCGLVYIYGAVRISNHFKIMIRRSLMVFVYCWKFIVPPVLLALGIWVIVEGPNWPEDWMHWNHMTISDSKEKTYNVLGLIIALIPPAVAFGTTIVVILIYSKRPKALITPEDMWSPALAQHRALYTAGIRRAKSKAPYLIVEVESEVIDGEPYKGWIPFGFFVTPSKFTTLCVTEGFIPTDTNTKIKVAHHLQNQFGYPRGLSEEEVDGHDAMSGLDLLQRIINKNQQAYRSDLTEDQKSFCSQRLRAGSSISAEVLSKTKSVSDCSNSVDFEARMTSASLSSDNFAFQK